jgi:glycosyltransferase involved in cell wall biosynthesis
LENHKQISVFFPAYNDAPSLPGLIESAFRTVETLTSEFEVIVINDGSTDNTGSVLADLQSKHGHRLRVITHPTNLGYGAALRSGFAAARFELVFYTDGDSQYDVRELALLCQELRVGTGLVNGYKINRNDPQHRIWIGHVYNRFSRLLFGVKLRDIDCDFRLIRKSLLDRIALFSTSGTICIELVKKIELTGAEIVEVPVHHYPRLYGRSQFFRWKSLATTAYQLARLFVLLRLKKQDRTAPPIAAHESRRV